MSLLECMFPDWPLKGVYQSHNYTAGAHWTNRMPTRFLRGQIEIDYYFDEEMNTYVINTLDGRTGWWYNAYYDGGWRERSVFRMDHYPYKDKMTLNMVQQTEAYLESIFVTYRDEIRRKRENNNIIIVPEVIVEGTNGILRFENVEVRAHNLRADIFQPGVVTAIDTMLTLAEDGKISYDLKWYESIGTAGVVKSYWVNRINDDESDDRVALSMKQEMRPSFFFAAIITTFYQISGSSILRSM